MTPDSKASEGTRDETGDGEGTRTSGGHGGTLGLGGR